MKILVACEMSGSVRDALLKAGHDAVSCDLLPCLSSGLHYKGDVFQYLKYSPGPFWDLLIAFPPCTYLAKAQQWRYSHDPGRVLKRDKALEFVRRLFSLDIKKIAIENPVGYLNRNWRKPDQILSPHLFGDPYGKEVCFWLKGLKPLLYNQKNIYLGKLKRVANHTNSRMKQKEKTQIKSSWLYYPRLIEALVDQWTT